MKGLGTEARVGLLVLVAIALLAAFVFALGGFSFADGYTVYADFDYPGNVKPGAPVTVAGIKVGSVEEMIYRGRELDPETNTRTLVRLRLNIDRDVQHTIHEDALFYVTSQSVLGEQIIAIEPGSFERPPLAENSVVRGVDPPRLDLALALGYELLDAIVEAVRENREELEDLLGNIAGVIRALNELLNHESVDVIIGHVESATREADELLTAVDENQVRRSLRNLDRTLALVARDIDPILTDTRTAVRSVNETLDTVGPEQRAEIRQTIHQAAELAEEANRTLADARGIVRQIERGEGTVGALLMDEELYDDLQELVRDLKHNPWKFFWRE